MKTWTWNKHAQCWHSSRQSPRSGDFLYSVMLAWPYFHSYSGIHNYAPSLWIVPSPSINLIFFAQVTWLGESACSACHISYSLIMITAGNYFSFNSLILLTVWQCCLLPDLILHCESIVKSCYGSHWSQKAPGDQNSLIMTDGNACIIRVWPDSQLMYGALNESIGCLNPHDKLN